MSTRREGILREMGLAPLWRLRGSSDAEAGAALVEAAEPEPLASPPPASSHRVPLHEQGIPGRAAPELPAAAPVFPPPASTGEDVSRLDWDDLESRIRHCDACGLCKRRKQAVPGVGDRQAKWLFVGEGPGAEEDERGEPFVGQAGKLLDAMLASINLDRQHNVYIANAVKCRPPNNRTPETEELAACFPYLKRQIALLQPRLIVALGRPAAQALLNQEVKIGAARGKLFSHESIPVVVTYHPAYLLRNLHDKAKAWEDLCFARASMASLCGSDARIDG